MRHEWGGISPSPSLRNSWVQPGAGLVPMTPSLGPSVGVGYPVLGGISLSVYDSASCRPVGGGHEAPSYRMVDRVIAAS